MTHTTPLAPAVLLASLSATALAQETAFRSFLGSEPPELVAGGGAWIGRAGALSLERLRGHVVWLEFSVLHRDDCLLTESHLVRWDLEYRSKGLVVIEVDDGEIDTREALVEHLNGKGLTYPVLWDEEARTVRAYGVRRYPTAYLIGVDGEVIWEGNPTGPLIPDGERFEIDPAVLRAHESRIEKALGAVDVDSLGEDGAAFWSSADAARVEVLDESVQPFVSDFNAHDDRARLVVLLSPT